eukprot:gene5341-513_t
MIEHGADIKSQLHNGASKSDLALTQLLQFNCFGKYKAGAKSHRHSKSLETPFAVYLGLSVFAKTRKRHIIDMLYENGLSISYDRVLEISSQLGEAVVNKYVEKGIVCPPELKKGDGGTIGLTEDESALRRWMVAGPEVSRLVADYESKSDQRDQTRNSKHHDDSQSSQKLFLQRVGKLFEVIEELGNPFEEYSSDLMVLTTKDIADPNKADLVFKHHEQGKEQCSAFIERLKEEDQTCFYEPIKKNRMDFFAQEQVPRISKEKIIKENCQLFSRLFISCQIRECDLGDFFQFENQSTPASLNEAGSLYSCQKSQLVEIFKEQVNMPDTEPSADTIIVDGSALVNASAPGRSKTFKEYAEKNILPKIIRYSSKYRRTDLVFDVYREPSLKQETRNRRGSGVRRRVAANSKTPMSWKAFLCDNTNKIELFHFLAQKISETSTANAVVVTMGEAALANQAMSLSDIAPCDHEEADTRIFVHAKSAVLQGSKSLMIKANDADVVVLVISVTTLLKEMGLDHLRVALGQGVKTCWIPIHQLVEVIGGARAGGMPFFHAFTGCDVVSASLGDERDLSTLERFVVTMYDRSSTSTTVNEARLDLFARKQRSYLSIPPTEASLKQHSKRATYQGGIIWGQTMNPVLHAPSPVNWGWFEVNGSWKIHWTDLPPIAKSCEELTKCGCKRACTGRCRCFRSGLSCTGLCSCICQNQ